MTQAVKEELMVEIQNDIFYAVEAYTMMLTSSWKGSLEFRLDLKVDPDELMSLAAGIFLTLEDM